MGENYRLLTEEEVPDYIREMARLKDQPRVFTKRQRPTFDHINSDSDD